MNTKIGLLGSMGKMGNAIIKVEKQFDIDLLKFSTNPNPDHEIMQSKDALYEASEIIIDFSSSVLAHEHIMLAEKYKKPILIGTTGHENMEIFKNKNIPIAYCPNTCLEWLLMKELIKDLSKLNPDYVTAIDDIHSYSKVDAPSGTAKDLMYELGRECQTRSVRMPNLASWHRVSLFGKSQVLHFEHQVLDRSIYAIGAIKLALQLVTCTTGLYTATDLLANRENL